MLLTAKRHIHAWAASKNLLLMKMLAALLLSACMQATASGYGQGITLELKNASLDDAFSEITRQTGMLFLYENNVLRLSRPVTLSIFNATLREALDGCLQQQPLTWHVINRTVVISKKEEKHDKNLADTAAHIKGRVIAGGIPVAGASIIVKDTKQGTITNSEGTFHLKNVQQPVTLIITSVGYEKQELLINKTAIITIELNIAVSDLDKAVVIGYGTTTARLKTGNVGKVTAAQISKQPVTNPLLAMQGRIPGVYIQQSSGAPGGGISIRIRGQNSLRTAENSEVDGNLPLYIIDGVPFTNTSLSYNGASGSIVPFANPLNAINPASIKSIEVLKDADATAIYGSRGANGVIIITTRSGSAGKTKLDLNVYKGMGKVSRKMDLLNTPQYLEMREEAFANDKEQPGVYDFDLNGAWDKNRYTDWQKELIGHTAQLTNVQSSLSGGNSHTQFLIGIGYSRETTVFPGNFGDNKISGHTSISHTGKNERFRLHYTSSFSNTRNRLVSDPTQFITLPPNAPAIYQANGKLNWENSSWTNPFSSMMQDYTSQTNNLINGLNISYNLWNNVVLKANIGHNLIDMKEYQGTPIISQDPAFQPQGSATFSNNSINTWIVEPQAEWMQQFGDFKLNILAGNTLQKNSSISNAIVAYGYTNDAQLKNMLAAPFLFPTIDKETEYKYLAFFSRINLNKDDKYILNLTGRRDGSSRFGPGKRFANFGAIGTAWIFASEKLFRERFPLISFGKLRASYGLTGSDQIGDYEYLDTYSSTPYSYNGSGGLQLTRLVNKDYSWETNKKLEAALEMGIVNNRINFSVSWYQNRSSNQLVGYSLPVFTGQSSIQFNLPATVQNSGWEIEVQGNIVQNTRLQWSAAFNVSLPRNKLLAFPNLEGSSYYNRYRIGQPLDLQIGYRFAGVNPQTGIYEFETKSGQSGEPAYPTDYIFTKPKGIRSFGGLNNTINWRGFQFDCFLQFVQQYGRDISYSFLMPGRRSNQSIEVLNRWKEPGDNTEIQRFSQQSPEASKAYSDHTVSDHMVADASFLRLKNLALSYSFAESKIKGIELLRVFVQGQNLVTLTRFPGLDPENQTLLLLPPLKVLTAGIHLIL